MPHREAMEKVTAGAPRPARRTQAERRSESRARLLQAAVECLAERGYAGTTFGEVLRRAGMSNGAMWRHFRSKADLLVAATLHSIGALRELRADLNLESRPPAERLDVTVEKLVAITREPAFAALIELLLASRTDLELRSRLAASDQDAGNLFFESVARLLGPELAGHPDYRANLRAIAFSLYGTALTASLRSPAGAEQLQLELQRLTRALFGLRAAPGG